MEVRVVWVKVLILYSLLINAHQEYIYISNYCTPILIYHNLHGSNVTVLSSSVFLKMSSVTVPNTFSSNFSGSSGSGAEEGSLALESFLPLLSSSRCRFTPPELAVSPSAPLPSDLSLLSSEEARNLKVTPDYRRAGNIDRNYD